MRFWSHKGSLMLLLATIYFHSEKCETIDWRYQNSPDFCTIRKLNGPNAVLLGRVDKDLLMQVCLH